VGQVGSRFISLGRKLLLGEVIIGFLIRRPIISPFSSLSWFLTLNQKLTLRIIISLLDIFPFFKG